MCSSDLFPSHDRPCLSGYLKGTSGVVGAVSSIPESDISFTDITTGNVSTSKHGYFPKLPNDPTKFINGIGSWVEISAGYPVYLASNWNEFTAAVIKCNTAGGGLVKLSGTIAVPSGVYTKVDLTNITVEGGVIDTTQNRLTISSGCNFKGTNFYNIVTGKQIGRAHV